MSSVESNKSDEKSITPSNELVVTKYTTAAEIATKIMKKLIEMCKVDVKIIDICAQGDKWIEEETSKIFKRDKNIKKGIAFPTCISINNCVCHFSPLKSDPDVILKENDLVKIDLGVNVDGYISVCAHSLVVTNSSNKIKGRMADVLLAAHYCAEACSRIIKEGNKDAQVTDILKRICEQYKCKPVQGMVMHELSQHNIEGEKTIPLNPTEAQRSEHESITFKPYEVYGIDCLVSTGDGIVKEMAARTTVYKKTDEVYNLKLKASRAVYSEVEKRFGLMPFSLRDLEDEKKARLGIVECVNHKVMVPYPVLWEKENEYVAHFKYTLLLMPNGSLRITPNLFNPEDCESTHKIEDKEILDIIKSSTKSKKKKKKSTTKITNDSKNDDGVDTL